MKALEVFNGSEGAITRAYYAALEQRGAAGIVAVNLFRAQKCSTRAKKYRGGIRGVGSYRGMAYDKICARRSPSTASSSASHTAGNAIRSRSRTRGCCTWICRMAR